MKQSWIVIGRLACGLLLATFVFAGTAAAQNGSGSVIVKFNGPVRLPHALLLPGTYTFDAPVGESQDLVVVHDDHNQFVTMVRVLPMRGVEAATTRVLMSESTLAPPRITAVSIGGSTLRYEVIYDRPAGTLLAQKQPSAR